jgi:hypothetical protein
MHLLFIEMECVFLSFVSFRLFEDNFIIMGYYLVCMRTYILGKIVEENMCWPDNLNTIYYPINQTYVMCSVSVSRFLILIHGVPQLVESDWNLVCVNLTNLGSIKKKRCYMSVSSFSFS